MTGEIQSLIDALDERQVGAKLPLEPGERSKILVPAGWMGLDVDGESLLDHPRRAKGEVKVRSAKGFVDAVKQRWPRNPSAGLLFVPDGTEPPTIEGEGEPIMPTIVRGTPEQLAQIEIINVGPVALYADDAEQKLVAILNDDRGLEAGWRDHRVVLDVRKTPEWLHWTRNQGMHDQETFAAAIEEGQLEITDPPPAQMLRIAETFEATVGVKFKKGAAVRDGAQQYVYEETIDAKAAGGTVEVPEGFTITVAPFIGGPRYVVKARLKTRLVGGKFTIGYVLERPEETERAAFRDIAKDVGEQLNLTAVEGVAPASR